jgi:hypothetical protein
VNGTSYGGIEDPLKREGPYGGIPIYIEEGAPEPKYGADE